MTTIKEVKVSHISTLRMIRSPNGNYYIEVYINGHHVTTHDYGFGREAEMIEALNAKVMMENDLIKKVK